MTPMVANCYTVPCAMWVTMSHLCSSALSTCHPSSSKTFTSVFVNKVKPDLPIEHLRCRSLECLQLVIKRPTPTDDVFPPSGLENGISASRSLEDKLCQRGCQRGRWNERKIFI